MRTRSFALIMLVLGIVLLQPVWGGAKWGPQGTFIGRVNVAANTLTLVIKEHKQGSQTVTSYTVSPAATITLNGNPAKLTQVRKNQRVLSYTEGNKGVLDSLEVQD